MNSARVISLLILLAPAPALARTDLPAAIAEQERVLMRQPDDDAARLAYADLLLRAGDRAGAARETAKLEPLSLSPEQVARLDALRQRLSDVAR